MTPDSSKFMECSTCNYQWQRGTSGQHRCALYLREQLDITDRLLENREQVFRAIPECPIHGSGCVPHALEWIERANAALQAIGT
jgi:hypothetical protein